MHLDPRDYDSREDERFEADRDREAHSSSGHHDRDETRWAERDRDSRDRDADPRDVFMQSLSLPRGLEREIVHDPRDREYTLRGSETRSLSTVGAFRVYKAYLSVAERFGAHSARCSGHSHGPSSIARGRANIGAIRARGPFVWGAVRSGLCQSASRTGHGHGPAVAGSVN